MAILTRSGRVVIAESIALRDVYVAWGTGDDTWLTPPSEDDDATALMNEIGRRKVDTVRFVNYDVAGDIVLPNGRFSLSATPTNTLLIETEFDFDDAPSSVIREYALFVGSVPVSGLPVGQRYFTPGQILEQGRILHLENIEPIFRSPAIQEGFKVAVTF